MEPVNDFSDDAYLLRLQADDDRAFNAVFHRYAPGLCQFAQRHLHSPEEAEEITQECFLQLWQKRHELAPNTVFKSYLYTVAHHAILNQLRRRRYWSFEDYPENLLLAQLTTGSPLEYQELEQVYQAALAQLPPRQRQVFALSRHEGQSYAGIARTLAISVKSVETHMSHALKFLRSFFQKHGTTLLVLLTLAAG